MHSGHAPKRAPLADISNVGASVPKQSRKPKQCSRCGKLGHERKNANCPCDADAPDARLTASELKAIRKEAE